MLSSTAKSRALARKLRSEMTLPEVQLWTRLSRRQLGVRFRPQVALGCYVLDFYSHALGLAVEVDGQSHDATKEYDERRTRQLKKEFRVRELIRFTNKDVLSNIEGVVLQIRMMVSKLRG